MSETALRILVVEDEVLVAADLQEALERQGYDVPLTVRSGELALSVFDVVRPDLVLLDIRLKGVLTGIETARQLRQRRAVPFIYLTGQADRATLDQALATGPAAYLVKPFVERDLSIAIELALRQFAQGQLIAAAPSVAAPAAPAAPAPDAAAGAAAGEIVVADGVFVREGSRFVKVPFAAIQVLEAQGNYCLLLTGERKYMLTAVLSAVLDRLALPALLRVHRSFAINLAHVVAYAEGQVELRGGRVVPVGGSYREALLGRLSTL